MNQTIYFRKQVWKFLENEPDKSKLINRLLENHYNVPVSKPMPKIDGVSVGFCTHNYAKGLCKYEECNRKYQ